MIKRLVTGLGTVTFVLIMVGMVSATIVQNPDSGHSYELVLAGGVTWDQANAAANLRPGNWHLATITDATENAFIENLLAPGAPFFEDSCLSGNLVGSVCQGIWLGGTSSTRSSNDWSWVTGEVWSFTDWGPTAPFGNGDRLQIDEFRSQGQLIAWNDVPGEWVRGTGYIVESSSASPVPEPSTVLLLGSGLAGLAWYGRKRKKA